MQTLLDRLASAVRGLPRGAWAAVGVGLVVFWVFWPSLAEIAARWRQDVEYSHGWLVPAFAVYLAVSRRGPTSGDPSWWGLALIAVGLILRFAGVYVYFDWLATAAIVPCIIGLFALAGGRMAAVRALPAAAFLLFMIPLPYRFETALAKPLQSIATTASTYALQTFGIMAFSEGNIIWIGDIQIGVVEACSGLSMLLIFFALATSVVLVVHRPLLDKVLILLAAVPVAVCANVIRITVTGILHKTVGRYWADLVFHELAGWLMMPLALGLLWLGLRGLDWVLPPRAARPREVVAPQPAEANVAPVNAKAKHRGRDPNRGVVLTIPRRSR